MPEIKGKHVLVTGGAGFIGSHLVDSLLKAGAGRVVVVDNFFLGTEENLQQSREQIVLYRDDAADLGTMSAIIRKEKIEEESDRHQRTPHTVFLFNLTLQLHQWYQKIQSAEAINYSIFLPH